MRLGECDMIIADQERSFKAQAMREIRIDQMASADWDRVETIYLEGVATGHATFETAAPSWKHWDASHLLFARLVARQEHDVIGWAALSPVSQRCVYGGVAEVSVYVSEASRGLGVGRKLLEALIDDSERHGIWTLQAGIFPENTGSLALHQRCGFREVGRRERIGKLHGHWRDTILLERRSRVTGIE